MIETTIISSISVKPLAVDFEQDMIVLKDKKSRPKAAFLVL